MENRETLSHYAETEVRPLSGKSEADLSGVSWGAVIGGAFVMAALYLILLALGAGLGFSSVSPWSNAGASASALGTAAIIWLIFMEIISSSLGGYLTGRLRTKWARIHTDEVYFRDTANGFLAWAVALVITVTFLATAATSMAGSPTAGSVMAAGSDSSAAIEPNAYFVDSLFRSDNLAAEKDLPAEAEAARIFTHAMAQKGFSPADKNYLAQLVSAKTGLTMVDAEKRVSDVMMNARQTEDSARKLTARFLLWFFLTLLIGAFCASLAATYGGRQRDLAHVA